MNSNKLNLILLFSLIYANIFSQNPSWPLDNAWNQINCTFAEKHNEFHGAIDINLGNGTDFKAILDGTVENDAISQDFFITRLDFLQTNNNESHLKRVRYGDYTDPLSGILGKNTNPTNYSTITSNQFIGK